MNSTSSTLNALLIGVIVVAIAVFARDVLIPLALAGILSFILAVPAPALRRLPRPLAVVIAFAALFALGRVLAREVEGQEATGKPQRPAAQTATAGDGRNFCGRAGRRFGRPLRPADIDAGAQAPSKAPC